MQSPQHLKFKKLYPSIDTFCFDIDSTVFSVELLDEFASFCNIDDDEIRQITNQAMSGEITFASALLKRVSMVQTRLNISFEELHTTVIPAFIKNLLSEGKINLTTNFITFIDTLIADKKIIYFCSGGFIEFILPLFTHFLPPHIITYLQSQESNSSEHHPHQIKQFIYANEFICVDGSITANNELYTAQTNGKAKVLDELISTRPAVNNVVMVGDGVTDLQAAPPAKFVVGYGGVVAREIVRQNADLFIYDYQELL